MMTLEIYMQSKKLSKIRGYLPKHFSFNVDAGLKLKRRRLYQCRDGIYGGCSIAL
jgi:hypothetical protein